MVIIIKYNFLAKILLCGEFRVGKSSLVLRYVEDRFPGNYMATIGANFLVKTTNVELESGEVLKIGQQIWDVGGHMRSSQVSHVFYQGVMGALLVYDVTRRETLEKVHLWSAELLKYSPKAQIYLIGNKKDLENERLVSTEEGEQTKVKNNYKAFFETSAKTNEQVQETFENLATYLLKINNQPVT